MATWSADGKEVPEEIRAALTAGGALPEGPADAHVHVRSGVGSFLGETHLLIAGGRFRVAGRSTSLDPWAELVLSGRPRLDESGYRPVLLLPTRDGEQRLEVTSLEEAAVEDIMAALPPISIVLRPSLRPAGDPAAPAALVAHEEDLPDLPTVRAALLGTLARRIRQRRAELLAARHARRTVAIDHRVGTHRSHDDRWQRWQARNARRPRKVAPEVVPEARTPGGSAFRLLLVALLGAAVFFLFAFLGRALAPRP